MRILFSILTLVLLAPGVSAQAQAQDQATELQAGRSLFVCASDLGVLNTALESDQFRVTKAGEILAPGASSNDSILIRFPYRVSSASIASVTSQSYDVWSGKSQLNHGQRFCALISKPATNQEAMNR